MEEVLVELREINRSLDFIIKKLERTACFALNQNSNKNELSAEEVSKLSKEKLRQLAEKL